MFLFQPAATLFFLLLSSFFSFLLLSRSSLHSLFAERHRETERESERPWDGEKKLSRRPRNRPSLLSSLCLSYSKQQGKRILSIFFSSLYSSSILWLHLSLSPFLSMFQAAKKNRKRRKNSLFLFVLQPLSLSLSISFSPFVCLVFWEKKRKGEQKGSKEQFLMDHLLLFST
jgi:hypothetical protein